jgi:hypothetical protein
MEHPKAIGDRSTVAIMCAFRLQGWDVFLPTGENTRFDLVVERGQGLRRVQCKTGRLRDGAIVFATCSTYGHHPHPSVVRRDYSGQVDEFAVYCQETGGVYSIPIEELTNRKECRLRVSAPRNNQLKGIRLAASYEVARIDVY